MASRYAWAGGQPGRGIWWPRFTICAMRASLAGDGGLVFLADLPPWSVGLRRINSFPLLCSLSFVVVNNPPSITMMHRWARLKCQPAKAATVGNPRCYSATDPKRRQMHSVFSPHSDPDHEQGDAEPARIGWVLLCLPLKSPSEDEYRQKSPLSTFQESGIKNWKVPLMFAGQEMPRVGWPVGWKTQWNILFQAVADLLKYQYPSNSVASVSHKVCLLLNLDYWLAVR